MANVKRLLNRYEEITHNRLSQVCENNGASVHTKVRVADVVPLEGSGIDSDLFSYGLKAHFDFIVSENYTPLFAVEFDGPSHETLEQKRRDRQKLLICEHFDFPILRINAMYLQSIYRSLDLLTWCVEYWFAQRAINDAYRNGDIPPCDYVDPTMMISLPGHKGAFPLWLSAEPRMAIQKYWKRQKCLSFAPSEWVGTDSDGNIFGIAWLEITSNQAIYAKSAARSQSFSIALSELLSEILVFEIHKLLEQVLAGKTAAKTVDETSSVVTEFQTRYELLHANISSSNVAART